VYLIVAYDVPAGRTEKYRKLLARYLPQLQYRVFGGDLTEVIYRKLRRDMDALYENTDRLVFVQTANRRNIRMEVVKDGAMHEDKSHLGGTVI
jgi:CRISPR-associated endonuclease Cas2